MNIIKKLCFKKSYSRQVSSGVISPEKFSSEKTSTGEVSSGKFSSKKSYSGKLYFFVVISIISFIASYIWTFTSIPGEIVLIRGREMSYITGAPFYVSVSSDKPGKLKINREMLNERGSVISLSKPLMLSSNYTGNINLVFRFLGILPLSSSRLSIIETEEVLACGNTVGVKLEIDGILVIATSDVLTEKGSKVLPAAGSGIRPGDYIVEANGKRTENIENLISQIDTSEKKGMQVKLRRGNRYLNINIIPVKAEDGKLRIGLWVRDNTAGIGTLTYVDPSNGEFGALGHGITDSDTGMLLPVRNGDISEPGMISIKKGLEGAPGELKGLYYNNSKLLGTIKKNCEQGIYGLISRESESVTAYGIADTIVKNNTDKTIKDNTGYAENDISDSNENSIINITENNISDEISWEKYPIGLKASVHEGPAFIISDLEGKGAIKYSIFIEKVMRQAPGESKGMVIRIDDKTLLKKTGGIVQGMSGCPVIQDGKLIGAVTHVLVNDPARGYGIFIENMLKNTMKSN